MGGLFSAPKPVIVAAPVAPAAATTVAETETQTAEEAGREAEAEARARAVRGRAGTIATSARGVLAPLPSLARKSLLGE